MGKATPRAAEAVIDRDLAGERPSQVVNADVFLILTDVENVKPHYGNPGEKKIDTMTMLEAEQCLAQGHFLNGSMGARVKACLHSLE